MSSVRQRAVDIGIEIAEDPAHGYDQEHRWGPDYDCSSFVITCYKRAGADVNGATTTVNMRQRMCTPPGQFTAIPFADLRQLRLGDILLNTQNHTCLYIGEQKVVEASINENGETTGGQTGDQTGAEILVRPEYIYPAGGWNYILRYTGPGEIPIWMLFKFNERRVI